MKNDKFFRGKKTYIEIILTVLVFVALSVITAILLHDSRKGIIPILLFAFIHYVFNFNSMIFMSPLIHTFPLNIKRYTKELGKFMLSKMLVVIIISTVIMVAIKGIFALDNLVFTIHFILLSAVVTCSLYLNSIMVFAQKKSLVNSHILFYGIYYNYLVLEPFTIILERNYSVFSLLLFLVIAFSGIVFVTYISAKPIISKIDDTGGSYDVETQ